MPKMGVDPDAVKKLAPQPKGWYKLKLTGFKPKLTKDKSGVNYNGNFEILNPSLQEANAQKSVRHIMCTKMAKHINDIVHGLGFALQDNGELPGSWEFDPADPENVEKAQYKGPLIGKTLEAELDITSYQGDDKNEIRQVRCALANCATRFPDIKHLTNMIGKK